MLAAAALTGIAFAAQRRLDNNGLLDRLRLWRTCRKLYDMPSILQQQLQQVSTTWGALTGKRQRGKPSLLYTAQEAADVDLQSLYELAQEGKEAWARLAYVHAACKCSAELASNLLTGCNAAARNIICVIASLTRVTCL